MDNNNIIIINKLEQIPNINSELNNDFKITINFSKSFENILYDFINKNYKQKNIYLGLDCKTNIDIIELNFEMYLFFLDCVEKSHDFFLNTNNKNSELKKLFESFILCENIQTWNFCIVHNVMFNYPFTLNNIIFIPINYLEDNFKSKNTNNIATTITHEKLHITQRYCEEAWNDYIYNQDNNWIKLNNSNEIFIQIKNNIINNGTDTNINITDENEEFITNPDTDYDNFKYVYKINNDYYYGNYVYNKIKKNIYIKYFKLDKDKKKLIKTDEKFKEDHPYEQYAYKISEIITQYKS